MISDRARDDILNHLFPDESEEDRDTNQLVLEALRGIGLALVALVDQTGYVA